MKKILSNASIAQLRIGAICYSLILCGSLAANAQNYNSGQDYSRTVDDTRTFVNGKVVSGHLTERVGRGDRIETYVDGQLTSTTPINPRKVETPKVAQSPIDVADYIQRENRFRLFQGVKSINVAFPELDGTGNSPQVVDFARRYKARLEERLTLDNIKIDKRAPLSIGINLDTITVNDQKVQVFTFKLQVNSWASLLQAPKQNFFVECWSSENISVNSLDAASTDPLINKQISKFRDDYIRANPGSFISIPLPLINPRTNRPQQVIIESPK